MRRVVVGSRRGLLVPLVLLMLGLAIGLVIAAAGAPRVVGDGTRFPPTCASTTVT